MSTSGSMAAAASSWTAFWAAHLPILEYLAVTIMFGVICSIVVSAVLRAVSNDAMRARHPIGSSVLRAARTPILNALWLVVLYCIARTIILPWQKQGSLVILDYTSKILFIFILGWALFRITRQVEQSYPQIVRNKGHDPDPMICDAMGKIARIVILIVTGLMILRVLDFSIASLLAFGGVAGIAIGFAAQGVVSNLFGALIIYIDRPFKVGEWIVLPSQNIYGTVEHIGWRATTLRGFDTRPYYVPNQIFNSSVVQTPPRMLARRIYETISIRYTDFTCLENIVDECRRFIARSPEIDHHQSEMIYFTKFGNHALEIMVYCFAKTQDWKESLRIQERVLIDLGKIIRRHGAEIAVPVSKVELAANVSQPEPPPLSKPAAPARDAEVGIAAP